MSCKNGSDTEEVESAKMVAMIDHSGEKKYIGKKTQKLQRESSQFLKLIFRWHILNPLF